MALLAIPSRRSFRRQIILTFVVGFFLLIAAFAAFLISTERNNLHRDSVNETTSMAQSLAASALPWVLADDVAGLQEVVHAFHAYPEFKAAMVMSPDGRVLAHSDPSQVGRFLNDEQSQALLKSAHATRVMEDSALLIDVAVPIEIGNKQVGWARVASTTRENTANLHRMIVDNLVFLLISTILSFIAAMLLANRLGQRIESLVQVAEGVQAGNFAMRVSATGGEDEVARLGSSLNKMLDTLSQNAIDLRRASLYTRSLIEASVDPLVTISTEGKITDVNEATEKVTGRSRTQLVGTDFSDYFTEPDQARAGYQEVFAKGSVTDYPLALRHRDGRITDVLYNASVYRDGAGKVLGVFAAARDVTERNKAEAALRESEALLHATMDILPLGLWILDAEGKISFGNDAARQIWAGVRYVGIEQLGEYKGWRVDTGKPVGPHEWAGARALEKGETTIGEEIEIECFDGTHKIILDSAVPLRNPDGSIRCAVTVNQDITERKRAEMALQQSEEVLKEAQRIAHLGSWYMDVATNQVVWSEELYKIYGFDPALPPPLYTESVKLFTRESWERLNAAVTQAREAGIPYELELETVAKDGGRGWMWARGEPVHDARGAIVRVRGVVMNITERKKLETQHRQSFAYTRSLIEASLDPLVTISAEGKITDVNQATEKATGRSRSELVGTDFADYFSEPDKARAGYQQVFAKGFVTDYPLALRHRDGHVTDVLYNASVYRDEAGNVLGVFAAARDITERKKAELEREQYFKLFNTSTDLMGIADPNGAFKKVNPAFMNTLGYSEDEILAKPFIDFVHPDDRQPTLDEMARQLQLGYSLDFENRYLCKDGSFRWLSWRATVNHEEGLTYAAARDITERKQAEADLAQLSLQNQLILDSAGEGIYGLDIDGRITFANPAASQLLGFGVEELIGRNSHSTFHHTRPDGSPYPEEECPVHAAYKQGAVRRGEDQYWRKDGGSFPVEFISTPILESGEITGAVVTFRDITERKQAEERVRDSEKKFRSMTDTSPLAIYMSSGIEQKAEYINPTFTRLFGYTLEEVPSVAQWWPLAYPDEKYRKQIEEEWQRKVARAIETNSTIEPMDVVVTCKDGSKKNILWGYTSTGVQNWAFGLDLTERKKAEEKLRHSEASLAEAQRMAHLGNWNLDLTNNVLTWSDEIYRIFEIDPKQFGASYDAFLNAIHPDDRELVNKAYTESVRDRTPYDIVHRLQMQDGRIKFVNERCETYYGDDGKPLRSVGMVHDVTERKLAEDEVKALNRDLEARVTERTAQLETANKELEAFSYSVSHDLRSPLRAIDGFSNILLEDYAAKLDAEGVRLLGVVRENTVKMGQLIDDILKFSRAGRLGMTMSEIDMEGLAREVYEDLRTSVTGHELQVEIGQLPPSRGDRAMMRQVMVNLLSNAIKFTRTREPARVKVGARTEGSETIYFVQDNGAGFDMRYVDRLFGVFQRLHAESEFEGTGIGLAIVKRIVARHGGRVWAEGKLDEGATIYFALPAAQAASGGAPC